MIAGLDHVVIGVKDLRLAVRRFADVLGFDVAWGGVHSGFGTENALIGLADGYLELLGVRDEDEARLSRLGRGAVLVDAIARGGGLLAYALRSKGLAEDVARLRSAGVSVTGPMDGERKTPEGDVLRWRVAYLGCEPWRSPFPFLIEWIGRAGRPIAAIPGAHAVGAERVASVSVETADPEAATGVFRDGLGLVAHASDGERARVEVPGAEIELVALRQGERRRGAGGAGRVARVTLAVRDIGATTNFLERAGVPLERDDEAGVAVAVGAEPAGRTDLRFVQA